MALFLLLKFNEKLLNHVFDYIKRHLVCSLFLSLVTSPMANQGGSTLAGFGRPDLQLHVRSSAQNYDPRREKSTGVNISTVTHQFSLRVLNRLLHHNRKILKFFKKSVIILGDRK